RRTEQRLLEAVVEHLGETLARTLLGERQFGREPTQLYRPPLELSRSLLQRGVAFSERALCLVAHGDVGNKRDRVPAVRSGNVRQVDFDRKHGSVLTLPEDFQTWRHRPRT